MNQKIRIVPAILITTAMLCCGGSVLADQVVHAYEFNTLNDTEGFSGLNVTGLTADGDSLNGAATAASNDPQLSIGGAGLTPTAGETWTTLQFRVREVRGAPHGSTAAKGAEPTTADVIDFDPVGLVVGNAPGTLIAGTGTAVDADGFSVVTFDISSFGSSPFVTLRFDPIGGAWSNSNSQTQGNSFEVDWIRISDTSVAVPEPTSMALLGLAGLGVLVRRKRNV